jgi:hypothetical protein
LFKTILIESIVDDAAMGCFHELIIDALPRPPLTLGDPTAGVEALGEVELEE